MTSIVSTHPAALNNNCPLVWAALKSVSTLPPRPRAQFKRMLSSAILAALVCRPKTPKPLEILNNQLMLGNEGISLDERVSLAKKYEISKDFDYDTYIDAKDGLNNWCVGEIMEVNKQD